MGVCNCSMFCCTLLCVHSSIAIILMGKRELVALLNFSSWCLVMVERLFLVVPRGCLQFVIVVFPDHTHLLSLGFANNKSTDQPAHPRRLISAFVNHFFWKKSYLNLLQAKFLCSWGDWFECRFVGNSEALSSDGCEQQRRRPACASAQTDQRLYSSRFGKNLMKTCYKRNFSLLASLWSWGDWFECRFVGNSEDRFCLAEAQ